MEARGPIPVRGEEGAEITGACALCSHDGRHGSVTVASPAWHMSSAYTSLAVAWQETVNPVQCVQNTLICLPARRGLLKAVTD